MKFIIANKEQVFPRDIYDENETLVMEKSFTIYTVCPVNSTQNLIIIKDEDEVNYTTWKNEIDTSNFSEITEYEADEIVDNYRRKHTIIDEKLSTKKYFNKIIKKELREEIDKNIDDDKDLIADISKMQSLMFGIVRTMWSLLDDSKKSLIDPTYKAAIDYAIVKFNETTTIADVHWATEGGVEMTDKLFDKQSKIGEKTKNYLNKKIKD